MENSLNDIEKPDIGEAVKKFSVKKAGKAYDAGNSFEYLVKSVEMRLLLRQKPNYRTLPYVMKFISCFDQPEKSKLTTYILFLFAKEDKQDFLDYVMALVQLVKAEYEQYL